MQEREASSLCHCPECTSACVYHKCRLSTSTVRWSGWTLASSFCTGAFCTVPWQIYKWFMLQNSTVPCILHLHSTFGFGEPHWFLHKALLICRQQSHHKMSCAWEAPCWETPGTQWLKQAVQGIVIKLGLYCEKVEVSKKWLSRDYKLCHCDLGFSRSWLQRAVLQQDFVMNTEN